VPRQGPATTIALQCRHLQVACDAIVTSVQSVALIAVRIVVVTQAVRRVIVFPVILIQGIAAHVARIRVDHHVGTVIAQVIAQAIVQALVKALIGPIRRDRALTDHEAIELAAIHVRLLADGIARDVQAIIGEQDLPREGLDQITALELSQDRAVTALQIAQARADRQHRAHMVSAQALVRAVRVPELQGRVARDREVPDREPQVVAASVGDEPAQGARSQPYSLGELKGRDGNEGIFWHSLVTIAFNSAVNSALK